VSDRLRIVMRHGAETWEDLAVELVLEWPGPYHTSSGFAPTHRPEAIVDDANTRGAETSMHPGDHPIRLDLSHGSSEPPAAPLSDHVWPKFLSDDARLVFELGGGS
jgi:hypothetical protein